RKILRINFVHCAEITHVFEEDGSLYDAVKVAAGRFENSLHIFQGAFRLLGNVAADKFIGGRIERVLAGSKKKSARFDCLRIRTDGFWSAVGKNDILHGLGSSAEFEDEFAAGAAALE